MHDMRTEAKRDVLMKFKRAVQEIIAEELGPEEADNAQDFISELDDKPKSPESLAAKISDKVAEEAPEEDEEELSDVQKEARDYFSPKKSFKRPGTAMMIAIDKKIPSKKNKGFR